MQYQDYYPYGMVQPGRNGTNAQSLLYRYGMSGMERMDETSGNGNSYTSFFRQYDARLGRWFSTDPVFQPWMSTYMSFDGNPIIYSDPRGDKVQYTGKGSRKSVRKARRESRRGDGKFNQAFKKMKKDEDLFKFNRTNSSSKETTEGAQNTINADKVLDSESGAIDIGRDYRSAKTSKRTDDVIILSLEILRKKRKFWQGVIYSILLLELTSLKLENLKINIHLVQ